MNMIAVSITSGSVVGVVEDIRLAEKSGADMVELRLDFMNSVLDSDLKRMLDAAGIPVIVTLRRKVDGGCFEGTEKERCLLLRKACDLGADYVDIELDVDTGIFKDTGTKIICSYHNFSQTPSVDDMLSILKSCLDKQPDVVKIVTMAKKYKDNLVIFDFLERSEKIAGNGVEVVSFCMGDKGKLSRAFCTKFGSFLTFASLKKGMESAPGQIDVGLLKEFDGVVVG